MGADHTVTAPASLQIPRGTLTAPGNFIVERGNEPAPYDAPGDWAIAINSGYELLRPNVVVDAPQSAWSGSGINTYTVIARYKVPVEHCGTGISGSNGEGLFCRVRIKTSSMLNIAAVRFSTPDDTATATMIVNTTYAWVDVGTAQITDSLGYGGDPEITVEVLGLLDGTGVDVDSIEVAWADERTQLPNGVGGPYDNEFCPLSVPAFSGVHNPIGTEQMRRVLRNLRILKATRTGGLLMSSSLPASTNGVQTANGSAFSIFQGRVWYRQYMSEIQFWIYALGDTIAPSTNKITVSVGDVSASTFLDTTAARWHSLTLYLERDAIRDNFAQTFYVITANQQVQVDSCCVWWKSSGRLRR